MSIDIPVTGDTARTGPMGVSSKAVIFNPEGKFLVLLRGETAPSHPSLWDLPGGEVDFGEDPTDAIRREISEECGLEVEAVKLLSLDSRINSDGFHWFTASYTARVTQPEVILGVEHDEYQWVTPEEFALLQSWPVVEGIVAKATGSKVEGYLKVEISAETEPEALHVLNTLLKSKLVTGGPILTAPARFWWKGEIVDVDYCTVTTYTTRAHRSEIIEAVRSASNEEVPMITFTPLDANSELNAWIDEIVTDL